MNDQSILDNAIEIIDKSVGDFEPGNIHWVSGRDFSVDEQNDRCYACTKKKVEELTKKHNKEFIIDGGWSQESDTCAHCEDCGTLLNYSLTSYGVESELDHFMGEDIEIDLTCADEAYHIGEVLSCYRCYDDYKTRIIELAKKIMEKANEV